MGGPAQVEVWVGDGLRDVRLAWGRERVRHVLEGWDLWVGNVLG
jgi:hypothetical protein